MRTVATIHAAHLVRRLTSEYIERVTGRTLSEFACSRNGLQTHGTPTGYGIHNTDRVLHREPVGPRHICVTSTHVEPGR